MSGISYSQRVLSPRDSFSRCQNGAIVFDIRPEAISLFKGFDVPEVLYCPRREVAEFLHYLPVGQDLIVSDSTGVYSRKICRLLENFGLNRVFQMAGGFVEWESDGLPVRMDNNSRLSGSCVCQLKYRNRELKIDNQKTSMKILILCTGNSCRSQMAQGFLQSFDPNLVVCSAGTQASGKLNEKAVSVMQEIGIDISEHTSDPVEMYLNERWDWVITVCGGAKESCPIFVGKVKHQTHIGFEDPSDARGSDEYIWSEFRRIRDEISREFRKWYESL